MRSLAIGAVMLVLVLAVIGIGFILGLAMFDGSPIYNDLNTHQRNYYHAVNNNK